MTNKMWVDVNTAADILKVSRYVISRKIAKGELKYRKPGPNSTQISRSSLCQDCLKDYFPAVTDFPLNCDICPHFKE